MSLRRHPPAVGVRPQHRGRQLALPRRDCRLSDRSPAYDRARPGAGGSSLQKGVRSSAWITDHGLQGDRLTLSGARSAPCRNSRRRDSREVGGRRIGGTVSTPSAWVPAEAGFRRGEGRGVVLSRWGGSLQSCCRWPLVGGRRRGRLERSAARRTQPRGGDRRARPRTSQFVEK